MAKRLMLAALTLTLAGCATMRAMANSPYVSGTLDLTRTARPRGFTPISQWPT